MLKITNAPCSWGALEFDLEGTAVFIMGFIDKPFGSIMCFSMHRWCY